MNRTGGTEFDLYLITDRHQTSGRPLEQVVESALAAGAEAIQLREKDLPVRNLLSLASEIRALTIKKSLLIINDRIDICLAVGADGVHLRSDSFGPSDVRNIVGPGKLIGVSCHSLDEIRMAETGGADFATLGPVYATPSKSAMGEPMGIERFRSIVRSSKLPIYALGGMRDIRIAEAVRAGARGVAMISGVWTAGDIRVAVESILRTIRSARDQASSQGAVRPEIA